MIVSKVIARVREIVPSYAVYVYVLVYALLISN